MRTVILIVALAIATTAHSSPPQTIDYQGYLTDSGGVPLTGNVNLTVTLYNTSVGGTGLWTQTSTTNLTNGRFSIILDGTSTNMFPAGLFNQQLHIGLAVNSDPEMTPRQALTSVPSAFEAINADTLDGLEATQIISSVENGGLRQFLGFTVATIDGKQGIRKMTELCQAEFPVSRVCNTEEYVKTIDWPATQIPSSTEAWITPGGLFEYPNGVMDKWAGVYQSPARFNCRGWTSFGAIDTSLTVSGTGQFLFQTSCNTAIPVACCGF